MESAEISARLELQLGTSRIMAVCSEVEGYGEENQLQATRPVKFTNRVA